MRKFDSGATRNNDKEELDYEAFISPIALKRYAEYMHSHRTQADGTVRGGDNWQKGIPLDSYAKSMIRHTVDFWLNHRGRGEEAREDTLHALCAIIFNAMGYIHELEKNRRVDLNE